MQNGQPKTFMQLTRSAAFLQHDCLRCSSQNFQVNSQAATLGYKKNFSIVLGSFEMLLGLGYSCLMAVS